MSPRRRGVKEDDHEKIDEAFDWSGEWDPARDPEVYEWIVVYATEKFRIATETLNRIEAKDESLLRYVGASTLAAVTVIGILGVDRPYVFWSMFPGLVGLLWTMLRATGAAREDRRLEPPPVRAAFEYADYFEAGAKIRFYSNYAVVEAQLASLIDYKRRLYLQGLVLLLCSLVSLGGGAILSMGGPPRRPSVAIGTWWLLSALSAAGFLWAVRRTLMKTPLPPRSRRASGGDPRK